MITIMNDLNELVEQVERLKTENGLLRKASEEQRELNGSLRKEYNEVLDKYETALKHSAQSLNNWNGWFDIWAIMLDGTCYTDAYEHYCSSRDSSEIIEGAMYG